MTGGGITRHSRACPRACPRASGGKRGKAGMTASPAFGGPVLDLAKEGVRDASGRAPIRSDQESRRMRLNLFPKPVLSVTKGDAQNDTGDQVQL